VSDAGKRFRFGLIGAGVAPEIHVAAVRTLPGVEVAAVADADLHRARAFASRYDNRPAAGGADPRAA
jgi:predicted dehydrogenase